jgi:hypothetical protein
MLISIRFEALGYLLDDAPQKLVRSISHFDVFNHAELECLLDQINGIVENKVSKELTVLSHQLHSSFHHPFVVDILDGLDCSSQDQEQFFYLCLFEGAFDLQGVLKSFENADDRLDFGVR